MDGWTASNQEIMPVLAAIIMIVLLLPIIAALAFHLMCQWKIQKKAGNPGWYCLLPIFGPYQLGLIASNKKWTATLYALSFIPAFIFLFMNDTFDALIAPRRIYASIMLLSFAGLIFHILFQVFIACELLRSFGKNRWAGLTSILFPIGFVFVTAYIALSNSVYCSVTSEKEPQAAGVANMPYAPYMGQQGAQTGAYYEAYTQDPYYRVQRGNQFCTRCGSSLKMGVRFCENCGHKIAV